jgi:hypothetical protein
MGDASANLRLHGVLDEGELDSYTFIAQAGDAVGLQVTDLAGGALALWPEFAIYGPAGDGCMP